MNEPLLPELSTHQAGPRRLSAQNLSCCFIPCGLCCLRRSSEEGNNRNHDDEHRGYNSGNDFLLQWFDTISLKDSSSKFTDLMKDIFENHTHDLSLSGDFIDAMLEDDEYVKDSDVITKHSEEENQDENIDDTTTDICEENESLFAQHLELYQNDHYILKGIPIRPFYKTLAVRILLLLYHRLNGENAAADDDDDQVGIQRPLIDATELGFTELESRLCVLDRIVYRSFTKTDIIDYLNDIEMQGILEYLGLRSTIGTAISDPNDSKGYIQYLKSIPNPQKLIDAANEPLKPNSNPPHLTLAGRARAKHAHRGSKDQFFGVCTGSTKYKNEAANQIVTKMIERAVWINLHVFGGVDHPVLEVRTKEGYGARWRIQNQDGVEGQTFTFRGFLEPQMNDGFQKKWRH